MSDGERLYIEARLKLWRKQYQRISSAMLNCIENGWEPNQTYGYELSRLSWLIEKAKEKLGMNRYMYDSTAPEHIPAGARIVAYYPHAWGTDLSAHAEALQIRIDNRGDHADDCHVLDVESGAATNEIAAEWVASWHKLHPAGLNAVNGWIRKPVIYTSTSNLAALRATIGSQDYEVWAAQWDNNTTPIPGCFAKQYADSTRTGGDYDASMVYDDTWGVSPAPVKPPAPVPNPPKFNPTGGMVFWTDDAWSAHARMVTSTDGGLTWK